MRKDLSGFAESSEGFWYYCDKCNWEVQRVIFDLKTKKFRCANPSCKAEVIWKNYPRYDNSKQGRHINE